MINEDKITQLEKRIEQLENYLKQFQSFRGFNKLLSDSMPTKLSDAGPRKKSSRGTRLREDWRPEPTDIQWARTKFPCVELQLETDKFVDYWLSRPDRGAIKLSWSRTFRNWIRNASQRYSSNGKAHKRTDDPSYTESVRTAFD